MDRKILVYVDLLGTPHLVGRLRARTRRDNEGATFRCADGWLANPNRFSLEPALTLGTGPFHTPSDKPLFGAIGDSAPDRWGRILMRRAERRRAETQNETPRTLREIDYHAAHDPGHSGEVEASIPGGRLAPRIPSQPPSRSPRNGFQRRTLTLADSTPQESEPPF